MGSSWSNPVLSAFPLGLKRGRHNGKNQCQDSQLILCDTRRSWVVPGAVLSTLTGKHALVFAPAPPDAVARIENAEIERSRAEVSDWDQGVFGTC